MSSDWRETAAPLSVATFDALLKELAEDAPHWNATDILATTEASDRLSPGCGSTRG
jgi:hypothetical protein